jgi:ribosome-binding protein aMBF1 (putative translation factor)
MATTASKCPVCQWEIKDDGKQVKVKGRVILVCCDDCAAKVKADPIKYINGK